MLKNLVLLGLSVSPLFLSVAHAANNQAPPLVSRENALTPWLQATLQDFQGESIGRHARSFLNRGGTIPDRYDRGARTDPGAILQEADNNYRAMRHALISRGNYTEGEAYCILFRIIQGASIAGSTDAGSVRSFTSSVRSILSAVPWSQTEIDRAYEAGYTVAVRDQQAEIQRLQNALAEANRRAEAAERIAAPQQNTSVLQAYTWPMTPTYQPAAPLTQPYPGAPTAVPAQYYQAVQPYQQQSQWQQPTVFAQSYQAVQPYQQQSQWQQPVAPTHPVSSGIVMEAIYQRFLNGKLIYKQGQPDQVILPFSQFVNPSTLQGTFDLSRCGDTWRYLSFYIGYRKSKTPESANKTEIWIAPRFLVERELSGAASTFSGIMTNWLSQYPLCVFFNRGDWELYQFLYKPIEDIDIIGKNLLNNYQNSHNNSVDGLTAFECPLHTSEFQNFYLI